MIALRFKTLPLLLAAALAQLPLAASAERVCELGDARQRSAITELCPLKNGFARIQIAHQWGFVDADGKLAIAPQFDEVQDFFEGLAAAKLDEQWGLIDQRGQWVVKPAFFELDDFSHGLARASNGSKDGYIDATGKWVIAPQYHAAGPFSPTVAVAQESAFAHVLIDRAGRVIKRFARDVSLDNDVSRAGLIDAQVSPPDMLVHLDGRRLPFPAKTGTFQDGLFIASTEIKDGDSSTEVYGLMDPGGKWVVPARFARLESFQGKLAVAAPFEPERERPRYGLIDRRGAFVVQPVYQFLTWQEYGYEGRREGEVRDVLDAQGKLLFTYECDNVSTHYRAGALTVLSGCDKHWLMHVTKGLVKRFDGQWHIDAAGQHIALAQRDPDSSSGRLFVIYDGTGRQIAGADPSHPFLGQRVDHVGLVASTAQPSDSARALPLAIFGNFDNDATGFMTRDHKFVTRPDWQYDSALLAYSGASGEQLEGPLVMKGADGFGAVNLQGNWVVPPTFSRMTRFTHGLALAVDAEGAQVAVDAAGRIYPLPENLYRLEPSGTLLLTGQTEDGRVTLDLKTGTQTPLVEPDEPDESGATAAGLTAVRQDGKWGLRRAAGSWALPPTLSHRPEPLMHNERLLGWTQSAAVAGETLAGLLDPAGRELVKPRYTALQVDTVSGLLVAQQDGYLHSVLDARGQPVLAPLNGKYTGLGDGWFKAEPEDLHGLLDQRGNWVVAPGRVEFELDNRYRRDPRPYSIVGSGAKRQLVGLDGRISTPHAPLSLKVEEPSQWWWTPSRYADGADPNTAFYGYDFKQRLRLPGAAQADNFAEGVIAFQPSDPKPGGRIGLMDDQGKLLGTYDFESIEPMAGGMAKVGGTVKPRRVTNKRPQADSEDIKRYGFINRAGKLLIPLTFEHAGTFSEKRATVVIGSGLAMIDEHGKILLQGSWQCGRTPVLMDSRRNVLWPDEARAVKSCAR